MPPRTVSADLKARIPVLRQRGHSVKHICHLLGVKKTQVQVVLYKVLWLVQQEYRPASRLHHRWHHFHHSSYYLCQRATAWIALWLWCVCVCANTSSAITSQISAYHSSRTELIIFMNSIAEIAPDPKMLMFGDKSAAKDETTLIRRHGRSRIGMRYVKFWSRYL